MNPLRIIIVGTVASDPYAGMAWMNMQLTSGFQRMGHDVYYFETTSAWPYNPVLQTKVDNSNYAVPYLKKLAEAFGLKNRWAYRCSYRPEKNWQGLSGSKAEDLLSTADLVFNVSGSTTFVDEGLKTGRLIYYGTDPVYPEVKYAQGDKTIRSVIDEHDDAVTFGENIGTTSCMVPPLPNLRAVTRQPVILDLWKNELSPVHGFTTVGNWKQEGRDIEFNGKKYFWSKHHEFLKFLDLPRKLSQPIEVAMKLSELSTNDHGNGMEIPSIGVLPDEKTLLETNGWKLRDAPAFTTDPWTYQSYIKSSLGEFTFAKDQNISLKSGWFSERSACYLAAGRPVITQDTGFGRNLPTGLGLFSFSTEDDIMKAFDEILSNYEKNSKAAREIAANLFDHEIVLKKLLNDLN